jgi:iron(III) transport system substrate-binding protein
LSAVLGLTVALSGVSGGGWSGRAAEGATPDDAERSRVAQLVEAAKKEGALVEWSNQVGSEKAGAELKVAFRKRYGLANSFRIDIVEMLSGPLQAKLMEVIRANQAVPDTVAVDVIGFMEALVKEKALVAYDSPEYRHYAAMTELGLTHVPYYVADPNPFVIGWNGAIIKDDIASWKDLLRPQYKDKFSMVDATTSTSNQLNYLAWKSVLGKDFFSQLAKQRPAFLPRVSVSLDKLQSGEYPISIGVIPRLAYVYRQVNGFRDLRMAYPTEGVLALPGMWGILGRAQHPSAAKLWIDFIWGKEGREILAKHDGRVPVRADVQGLDPEFMPPITRIKGIKFDQRSVTDADLKAGLAEWRQVFGK